MLEMIHVNVVIECNQLTNNNNEMQLFHLKFKRSYKCSYVYPIVYVDTINVLKIIYIFVLFFQLLNIEVIKVKSLNENYLNTFCFQFRT